MPFKWGDLNHIWMKDSCSFMDNTRSSLGGISGYGITCGKMVAWCTVLMSVTKSLLFLNNDGWAQYDLPLCPALVQYFPHSDMGSSTNFCQCLPLWLFLSSSFSWQMEVTMRLFPSQASFRCWMQLPRPLGLHYAALEDPTHEICRNIFCCEAGWWKHLQNNWSAPLRDVVKELQLDVDAEIFWDSTKSWVCMNKATELCSEPHNSDLWWHSMIQYGVSHTLVCSPCTQCHGEGMQEFSGTKSAELQSWFVLVQQCKMWQEVGLPLRPKLLNSCEREGKDVTHKS